MKRFAGPLVAIALIGAVVFYDALRRDRTLAPELAGEFLAALEDGDLTGDDQIERLFGLADHGAGALYLERWNRENGDLAFDPVNGAFFLIERPTGAAPRLLYAREGLRGPMGLPLYFHWKTVEVRGAELHIEADVVVAPGMTEESLAKVGVQPGPKTYGIPLALLGEGLRLEHLKSR